MRKGYVSYYAKCPYYRKEYRMAVECAEGEEPAEGETYMVKFHEEKRAGRYKRRFCHNVPGCTDCPMYQMLDFECAARGFRPAVPAPTAGQ